MEGRRINIPTFAGTLSFMRHLLTLFLFSCCLQAMAQITTVQQKVLNSYVEYANKSAAEVAAVVGSLITYYPDLHRKSSWGPPRYVCPVQLEDYYINNALALSKNLSVAHANALYTPLTALREAAENIDEKCKALDTYHKLQDYKQDNFAKAETLIGEIEALLQDYKKKQLALNAALETVYRNMTSASAQGAYHKIDDMMRRQMAGDRALLDAWTFNLKQEVHTGWPVDKLGQSIAAAPEQMELITKMKAPIKYPASSMVGSFQEGMGQILEIKRNALNGYNFEAKKSDGHSNKAYMDLINYYNGTLVSFYNSFVDNALGDGYRGLKAMSYFPVFGIRAQAQVVGVEAKPYLDKQTPALNPEVKKTAVPKAVGQCLTEYVDFINETWRQTQNLQSTIENFSSSASYYKGLDAYDRVSGMTFDYKNYEVPLAEYQKAVSCKTLPPVISKALNDQSEVLLSILKELDDQCATLEIEVREKRYQADRLKKVYTILERQKVLYNDWDEKKEKLYNDLRKVYESYEPDLSKNSWYVSGKALRHLTDLDHDAVFKAKAYYKGDSSVTVVTDPIDQAVREVIANEFTNMKGIEKIGRNNGACPYTPYEDLPETSRRLSADVKTLKPTGGKTHYQHPYHGIVYLYNDIVDDYNKFCELSKDVYHLKTVKQPELFALESAKPKQGDKPRQQAQPQVKPQPQATSNNPPPVSTVRNEPKAATPSTGSNTLKVQHDTVYIEKRDTVYLSAPGEELRSMNGYAANNMVLLLDVSGSMNTPDKLPLLKQSVLNMISMMRDEDKVSIIAFSGKPKVLLESASFKDESRIRKAIDNLKSAGKTDGNAGLQLAYEVADKNYLRGGNNRIILATDGQFATSEDVLQLIGKFAGEDVFLSIFNFGEGMGNARGLEAIATRGKGNYEHISKDNIELKLIREAKSKRRK
jgi:Ca-activated chloride channel family protein